MFEQPNFADASFSKGLGKDDKQSPGGVEHLLNTAKWTRDDAPGGRKIVRGGSFFDPPARSGSTTRVAYPSWQRVFNVGFRVMCEESKMMGAK